MKWQLAKMEGGPDFPLIILQNDFSGSNCRSKFPRFNLVALILTNTLKRMKEKVAK